MPEVNKIIDILQSKRSFGRVIRGIQANLRYCEIAHWYNTWLGYYNSSNGRLESTAVMISVVFFIYLFIYLFVYLAFS
jgi:hypothetical protein